MSPSFPLSASHIVCYPLTIIISLTLQEGPPQDDDDDDDDDEEDTKKKGVRCQPVSITRFQLTFFV